MITFGLLRKNGATLLYEVWLVNNEIAYEKDFLMRIRFLNGYLLRKVE